MELFHTAWEWAENVRAKVMHVSQLKLHKQCKAIFTALNLSKHSVSTGFHQFFLHVNQKFKSLYEVVLILTSEAHPKSNLPASQKSSGPAPSRGREVICGINRPVMAVMAGGVDVANSNGLLIPQELVSFVYVCSCDVGKD